MNQRGVLTLLIGVVATSLSSESSARPISEIQRDFEALRREAREALAQAEAEVAATRAVLAEIDRASAQNLLTETEQKPSQAGEEEGDSGSAPVVGSGNAAGETQDEESAEASSQDRLSPEALRESKTGRANFGGIDFGIGLSFSYDLGGERRIREANVVNGVIRVTQADNARARLVLESHYLFTPNGRFPFGLTNRNCLRLDGERLPGCVQQREWGFGPFVALQPGSGAIIDAVGAGLMVGFRRPGEGNDSFNFGIGMLYDLDVRVLGPDMVANLPLPAGETEIRYQQREQASVLFLTSFTF